MQTKRDEPAPCRFTGVRSGEGSWPCCAAAPRPLVANLLRRCGVHREWLYLQFACPFGLLLQWVAATADASLDPCCTTESGPAPTVGSPPTPQAEPTVRSPNMRICVPAVVAGLSEEHTGAGHELFGDFVRAVASTVTALSVADASGTVAARGPCRAWQRPFGSKPSVRCATVQESVGARRFGQRARMRVCVRACSRAEGPRSFSKLRASAAPASGVT